MKRRKLLMAGLGATAGISGLTAAAKLADAFGLVPQTTGKLYGAGETLTYASQRLLTRHSLAREFSRDQISTAFANSKPPEHADFKSLQEGGFAGWRVGIEGMVTKPGSFSLADLRSYPSRSQITQLICEEGWSFIAEWTGVPLSVVLERSGILPLAKYVIYSSMDGWQDGMDMTDALHPQTLITYAMNGGDLPVGHGGPLRMRVPRQLGYKSVKFLNRIIVTDRLDGFVAPGDYSWYAGI